MRLNCREMEKLQQMNMNKISAIKDIKLDALHGGDNLCNLVAEQIRVNLQEPNGDLIVKIVSTLGVRKALLVYQKTRIIEESGGMLVHDGSRRRTPGGVFLHLITNDKTIPKTVIKEIFYDTAQETKKKKNEEARERRRKTNNELRELLIRGGTKQKSETSTGLKGKVWKKRRTIHTSTSFTKA